MQADILREKLRACAKSVGAELWVEGPLESVSGLWGVWVLSIAGVDGDDDLIGSGPTLMSALGDAWLTVDEWELAS